jgi:hypothetical protein
MKQFVGTWQNDDQPGTTVLWECRQFGNAFISRGYRIIQGTESFLYSENWVYSPKEDRFIGFLMLPSGNYRTWISSFTSEKKWAGDSLLNIRPDEIIGKFELILESPTKIIASESDKDGTTRRVVSWSKIK